MNKQLIASKIILHLPLTEKERAFAILYMGYDLKDLEEV